MTKVLDQRQIIPEELDAVIHERTRLSIVSILAARRKIDYLELKQLLQLTDGNLAGHVRVLEQADYVRTEKAILGRKTRTTYRLTPKGRRALQEHVDRLAALLSMKERKSMGGDRG